MNDAWKQCISILNDNHYDAYLVGGATRNFLLHLPVQDFDITTNATPTQIKKCFRNYRMLDIGIKHGTITVFINNTPYEITTYRIDMDYRDHRHPSKVVFSSQLKDDCMRRDFTMNAICYHPEQGYFDFFNGISDIENKIIRCIGNPNERFNEDALRILRAIRFSCQLQFTIEPITKKALLENKDLLKHISNERIQDELNKIFLSSSCAQKLFEYHDVLEVIIPECREISLSPKRLNKTYEMLSKCKPSIALRLSCLLHQLHEPALTSLTICKRLKYSNVLTKRVQVLLSVMNKPISSKFEFNLLLSQYSDFFEDILYFKCLIDTTLDENELFKQYQTIIQENECISLSQLDLKGNELLDLGYPKNQISTLLHECLYQVMQDKVPNKKMELITFLKTNK
ncbi:MAG: hypothetical protein RR738_10905 [Anaerorhabdus sp.]|uniref:CCA tRNA nucleotidyltransferase n=1 Tax=Anaerorhabdus sp. TaxID=1872524 RepID=UPI002FC5CC29